MVINRKGKWYVESETGKSLGGPYSTPEEAEERLRQVEYFIKPSHVKKK